MILLQEPKCVKRWFKFLFDIRDESDATKPIFTKHYQIFNNSKYARPITQNYSQHVEDLSLSATTQIQLLLMILAI